MDCPYIPGKQFQSENFIFPWAEGEDLDKLLSLGYRHFGDYFFRPFCTGCNSCIPLRVTLSNFSLGRSFRRLLVRDNRISATLEKSFPSKKSFSLYCRHKEKFGQFQSEDYDTYCSSFYYPSKTNYQLTLKRNGELLGVSHVDITDTALSAVYCYYDTDYVKESLGTLAVLKEAEIARSMGLSYMYLGYYVEGNSHMRYKFRFRPNEALLTEGQWVQFSDVNQKEPSEYVLDHGFVPQNRIT